MIRKSHVLKLLTAAVLFGALWAPEARACDIKIHEAAYKQWPREFYLLYMIYDGKNKLSARQEKLAKVLREKHFKDVNADVIKLNRDGSMLREDREFLSAQGCGGWPQLAILDKADKLLARASGKLGKRELRYLSDRAGKLPLGARVVILYKKSDAKSKKTADSVTLEKLAKADIKVAKIERLDAEAKAHRKLAARFKPPELPTMFLVSPRGTLLGAYPGNIRERTLLKAFDSAGRRRLTKALDKTAMTFVLVRGKDRRANAALLARFKKPLAKAKKLFKINLEVVEVNGVHRDEQLFVRNLGVKKLPAVVPVFGKGKHLEPMPEEFKDDDILDRAQFMIQNCTCVLNPSALGEDLLLKWKGIDEKVKEE